MAEANVYDQFDTGNKANPYDQFATNPYDQFDEGTQERDKEAYGKTLVKRWNKGLVDLINAPTNLINAGLRLGAGAMGLQRGIGPDRFAQAAAGAPQIPGTRDLEEKAYNLGLIPDPNEPAEGIGEHTAEILGAGTLPHIALTTRGSQVLNRSVTELQKLGIMDHLAVSTASRPLATAGGEALASTGAATGRTVAEENDAGITMQILAELLGGFTPAAFIGAGKLGGKISFMRVVANSINKNLLPFTKAGATPRASKRLQELAGDPRESARRIDVDSDVSPARQTGDDRLLALERRILDDDPELSDEFAAGLRESRRQLRTDALSFGGDTNRPRALLRNGKQYLIDLVDMRAAQAAQEAEASISRLNPNATPREISQAVRQSVDEAYTDARTTEETLWKSIDSDATVELNHGRTPLDSELAIRSTFDDPDDIPAWLVKALQPDEIAPDVAKQLQKTGLMDKDGNLVPGVRAELEAQGIIQQREFTFKDARALRSRVLSEIRKEKSQVAPNRNKVRILNQIANGNEERGIKGLLDDIGESGVEGAAAAREFSAALNTRFTKGKVGQLLGFERSGAQRVTEKETLDYLLAGRDPATTVNQLVKASPETGALVENYLKAEFLGQVVTDAGVNKRAANRFIQQWERRGAFEVYPTLKDELLNVRNLTEGAANLAVRADKVRTFANSSGKSRAALYLGAEPGEEMRVLLNSNRSPSVARSVVARVKNDEEALRGLKTSFVEEGFRRSASGNLNASGDPVYSGKKFTGFLNEYKRTAKALGFSKDEMERLETIATKLRQVEAKPGKRVPKVLEDMPSTVLDLIARYIGARSGGQAGRTLGSSLVMAQAFSQRARSILRGLTRNRAEEILIAAHQDPRLYRALLLRPDAPEPTQERAASTIKAWLVGVGATELEDADRESQ